MLLKKIILAAVSFLITIGVLEFAASRVVLTMAPLEIRDGLYTHPLPLITGVAGPPGRDFPTEGDPLPVARAENELRIAILGESSVSGSPFDVQVSIPAMVLDELRRSFPDRSVNVVNMGRPASIVANIYYYLIYLKTYQPDFIVFYMGMNDDPFMPGETCALGRNPALHGAWRTVVEHSWLAWLTRVYGPQFFWIASRKTDWYAPRDCPVPTFTMWTRLLATYATEMGAQVILVNPVRSAGFMLEPTDSPMEQKFPEKSPEYLAILACTLTPGCDMGALLLNELNKSDFPLFPSRLWFHDKDHAWRSFAWKEAAFVSGASHIEFERLLASVSPHGVLGTVLFADRQHLTPPGYFYLARLIAERIRFMITGLPERPVQVPAPAELEPYLRAAGSSGLPVIFEQFQRGHALVAVEGLLYSLTAFDRDGQCDPRFCADIERARLTRAWLRKLSGLDPGLPADRVKDLDAFDPMASFGPKMTL